MHFLRFMGKLMYNMRKSSEEVTGTMLENLIATLKSNHRTIVFTEGPDRRMLEAASRLKKDGILTSILIGKVDEVKAAAVQGGFDIEGIEIIDPATYPEMDAMVAKMVELRKGKM